MRKSGNIEVKFMERQEGILSYTKIGDMKNGSFVLGKEYQKSKVDLNLLKTGAQLSHAAEKLDRYVKDGVLVTIEEDGTTLLPELETGVYFIQGYKLGAREMKPTLVFLPTWDEAEEEMLYDVTVIPKLEEKVRTGDETSGYAGIFFGGSVFLMILLLFWKKGLRKHKNCDTMQ